MKSHILRLISPNHSCGSLGKFLLITVYTSRLITRIPPTVLPPFGGVWWRRRRVELRVRQSVTSAAATRLASVQVSAARRRWLRTRCLHRKFALAPQGCGALQRASLLQLSSQSNRSRTYFGWLLTGATRLAPRWFRLPSSPRAPTRYCIFYFSLCVGGCMCAPFCLQCNNAARTVAKLLNGIGV